MPGAQVRLIADAGAIIGESPLWREDALIWTDPVSRHVLRRDGSAVSVVPVEAAVWSLAALPEGAMVGALDSGFCAVSLVGAVTPTSPATLPPGCRFNDIAVDGRGGLWAGVMHRGLLAARGMVFHAPSLDQTARCVATGLGVPNGMKAAADGSRLFMVDTLMRTLLSFPILPDGTLDEPAVLGDFLDLPGKPDGMIIAPDGSFWVAMWGGGAIVQLAPDGAVLRSIAIPAPHVSSLCFAGPDRLFVTTSRVRLSPQMLARFPGSGGVFEVLL